MKHLITAAMVLIFSQHSFGDKQGRYCELEGAYTEDGRAVSGECYIYWNFYFIRLVVHLLNCDGDDYHLFAFHVALGRI